MASKPVVKKKAIRMKKAGKKKVAVKRAPAKKKTAKKKAAKQPRTATVNTRRGPRGSPNGRETGHKIMEHWVHLFLENAKVAKGKRLTDPQITVAMQHEFPKRNSVVFTTPQVIRTRFNVGELTLGMRPAARSVPYDDNGNAIEVRRGRPSNSTPSSGRHVGPNTPGKAATKATPAPKKKAAAKKKPAAKKATPAPAPKKKAAAKKATPAPVAKKKVRVVVKKKAVAKPPVQDMAQTGMVPGAVLP